MSVHISSDVEVCNPGNMMQKNLFINLSFIVIAIIFHGILQCSCSLSDKRLCYNPDCSEPVSLARTTITYTPKDPALLKFNIGVKVIVYSKEAGYRSDLWGVEINGKRGYVPKRFLREYKILHKDLYHEVPINILSNNNVASNEKLESKEKDDKSVFDLKDVETSYGEGNTLNPKPIEELPHNGTLSYDIIGETTFHISHDKPYDHSTIATENIQAAVMENKQNVIDNLVIDSNNDKTDSNIFSKDKKILQEIVDNKLKEEKQNISNHVKGSATNSKETSDSPNLVEIVHISPLDQTLNLENKAENELENLGSNSFPVKRDVLASENNINTKTSQTLPSNVKETFEIKSETTIVLNKQNNVDSTQVFIDDDVKIHKHNTSVGTFDDEGVTSLDTEQNVSKVEDKNTEDVVNESVLFLETNITTRTNATLHSGNVEAFEKNTSELNQKDYSLLENQLKEIRNTEELDQHNGNKHVAPLFLEPSTNITAELTLPSNNEDENRDVINLKSKSDEKLSDVIENIKVTSEAEMSITSEDINQNLNENYNISIVTGKGNDQKLQEEQNILYKYHHDTTKINEILTANNNSNDILRVGEHSTETPLLHENSGTESNLKLSEQLYSTKKDVSLKNSINTNEFRNRNLLNIEMNEQFEIVENNAIKGGVNNNNEVLLEDKNNKIEQNKSVYESSDNTLYNTNTVAVEGSTLENLHEMQVSSSDVCKADNVECSVEGNIQNDAAYNKDFQMNENAIMEGVKAEYSYWLTLMYLSVTAAAILIFSLGYYYIENMKRDRLLISRINKLEKDLLIATKECTMLNESLKVTTEKLTCIEDESFGSNEMVLSLKADLEASQNVKTELEDQVVILEKELENATEAGLELERMLREVLSSNNEVNPLAQSVEDLQARLNVQQTANESLTNVLTLKTRENETLSIEVTSLKKKIDELEIELSKVTENLKIEKDNKNSLKQMLSDKIQQLEMQIKEISTEKTSLQKELRSKEVETKDLLEVINQMNSNNLDLDKLYGVFHAKAEATALLEERNELKIRIVEIEGAHHLLEEHMKVVKEEMAILKEQCKLAEKEKKDAETQLAVLTNFFEEKEAQRQKEEAIWLQQQGEVVSTVERIQTMQNEIQNYRQQIEILKREIMDQEREYKTQISVLDTKAHEQWVIARQVERRLEESKVEASQLRNRLTLIEKNINDADSEAKLHRVETNGETATLPPLFIEAESSTSPIMFSSSSNVPPPPPPSYLHSLFPPYLPPPLPNTSGVPPYEVSQRPPPLGGRLSSPPPMPRPSASNRYENPSSPPPPMSPHLLPPFNHRSPLPLPFGSDIHPPPPPPGSILNSLLGSPHSWGEESLPPPRNSGYHPQRERIRNHKGSLHSSGESLDKAHQISKV